MTRARWFSLVLILVAGVIVALSLWRGTASPERHDVTAPAAAPAISRSSELTPQGAADDPADGAAPLPGNTDPYAASFDNADDMLAFAEGLHARAKAGDAAAMYYMHRALNYCGGEYANTFIFPDRHHTLDEVLVRYASFPAQIHDAVRKMHRQCSRMVETDVKPFESPAVWLQRSAEAGFPLGQVEYAAKLAMPDDSVPADVLSARKAEARKLALAALRSKWPRVIQNTSRVAGYLQTPPYSDETVLHAWTIVACQRGIDCSAGGDWFWPECSNDSNCQPYETGVDLIRRQLGDEFDVAERRAREIARLLDEDRLDELEF